MSTTAVSILLLLTVNAAVASTQYAVKLVGPEGYQGSVMMSMARNGVTGGYAYGGSDSGVAWVNTGGAAQVLNLGMPGAVTVVNMAGQAIGIMADGGSFFFDGSQIHTLDSSFNPRFLSENGIVAGDTLTGGFVWNGSTLDLLPDASIAGISSNGTVVGSILGTSQNTAFSYINVMNDLHGTLGGTVDNNTEALAINNSGDYVGSSFTGCGCDNSTGFVVIGGTVHQLPFQSASSLFTRPMFINESGQASGETDTDVFGSPRTHVFLYTPGSMPTFVDVTDGQDDDFVADVMNNAGHVTGSSGTQIFLYRNGSTTYYQRAGAYGWDMNENGDVVGGFGSDPAASFVILDGEMFDLNALNPTGSPLVSLDFAEGITNSGIIGGTGWSSTDPQAFVLTPVPEPGSVALIAAGGAVLLAVRRRRNA